MARVPIAPQSMAVAGLNPLVYVAPNATGVGNGNTFFQDGRTFLLVKNPTAGSVVYTIVANGIKQQGVAAANLVVTILTLKDAMIWVPAAWYGDSAGLIYADTDTVTGVLIAAIQMPPTFQ